MVVQRFCLAYMESPPPAVFHDKYQIRKYEKTQQGNLLLTCSQGRYRHLTFGHLIPKLLLVNIGMVGVNDYHDYFDAKLTVDVILATGV